MPPPLNPKLVPLYESAKKLAIARLRLERARKEPEPMDALLAVFRAWRVDKSPAKPAGK